MIGGEQPRCDEVYVMNLLGHLKLLSGRESGARGAEEYRSACQHADGDDAFSHYGRGFARKLVVAKLTPPEYRDEFRSLRKELDQEFAANPALSSASHPITVTEYLRFFTPARVNLLGKDLDLSINELFDWSWIQRALKQWKAVYEGPSVETLAEFSRKQIDHNRAIGIDSMLDRFARGGLSERARQAIRSRAPNEREFLRNLIVDPGLAERHRDDALAIGLGYGEVSGFNGTGSLDRLSYAAIDRRVARLQGRMAELGREALEECEVIGPGIREVIELRIALAAELEGDYRACVRHLLGDHAPSRGVSPRDTLAQIKAFLGAAQAQMKQARRFKDLSAGSVRLEWSPSVDDVDPRAAIEVKVVVPAQNIVASIRRTLWRESPSLRHVVIQVKATRIPLARIFGLSQEDEGLVVSRLADAATQSRGGTWRERLLEAPLDPLPEIQPTAEVLDAVPDPDPERPAEFPTSARVLLEQVLELCQPKPLTNHQGDVLAACEAMKPAPRLPLGDHRFKCTVSVPELAARLRADL